MTKIAFLPFFLVFRLSFYFFLNFFLAFNIEFVQKKGLPLFMDMLYLLRFRCLIFIIKTSI